MKHYTPEHITSTKLNIFFSDNRQRTLCYLGARFPVLDESDIEDIFQDSAVALFLKIQNNEYSDLMDSLYSLFLSICINQARNKVNRSHPTCSLQEDILNADFEPVLNEKIECLENIVGYDVDEENTDSVYLDWLEQQVRDGVKQMKPPCNYILWSFYWDGLSHRAIADMYGMKSEDVSKTQANRCKNKFSSFLKKVITSYDR